MSTSTSWAFKCVSHPFTTQNVSKKIKELDSETQLFFVTRMDFGTFLYLTHYARCWEEKRGKTCIAILSARYLEIIQLAEEITPKSLLIYPDTFWIRWVLKIFGPYEVLEKTFYRVYAQLFMENPQAIRLLGLKTALFS